MTPFEWFVVAVIVTNFVVGTVGGAIWKTQRDKVKNETVKAVIDGAVRAAEELDVSGQLNTSKQDYVWKIVERELPSISKNRPLVEMMINAAVQAAGIGATGKKKK